MGRLTPCRYIFLLMGKPDIAWLFVRVYCTGFRACVQLPGKMHYRIDASMYAESVTYTQMARQCCCRGLVIVGSPETLKSNPNWREWLYWVRGQNAVLHSDELNWNWSWLIYTLQVQVAMLLYLTHNYAIPTKPVAILRRQSSYASSCNASFHWLVMLSIQCDS